jgi:hypothetical protein
MYQYHGSDHGNGTRRDGGVGRGPLSALQSGVLHGGSGPHASRPRGRRGAVCDLAERPLRAGFCAGFEVHTAGQLVQDVTQLGPGVLDVGANRVQVVRPRVGGGGPGVPIGLGGTCPHRRALAFSSSMSAMMLVQSMPPTKTGN